LGEHPVLFPDHPVDVDDVFETVDPEVLDEGVYRFNVVTGGDPDESNLVTVLFLDRRDRAGFTTAGGSPRSPVPENGVGSVQ